MITVSNTPNLSQTIEIVKREKTQTYLRNRTKASTIVNGIEGIIERSNNGELNQEQLSEEILDIIKLYGITINPKTNRKVDNIQLRRNLNERYKGGKISQTQYDTGMFLISISTDRKIFQELLDRYQLFS